MENPKPFNSRKSTKIPNYDYSKKNFYFVTICTHEKKCIFGTAEKLNLFGEIAKMDMEDIACHYQDVYIDQFVIMPNHIHAIVVISGEKSQNNPTLNHIIGQYKSGVSRKIRKLDGNIIVWQRSYHDHVIRSRTSYEKICSYIQFNPQKWEDDCFCPQEKKP